MNKTIALSFILFCTSTTTVFSCDPYTFCQYFWCPASQPVRVDPKKDGEYIQIDRTRRAANCGACYWTACGCIPLEATTLALYAGCPENPTVGGFFGIIIGYTCAMRAITTACEYEARDKYEKATKKRRFAVAPSDAPKIPLGAALPSGKPENTSSRTERA
ncbi:hypothetical protein EBQ93_02785 [bacterium]|nr:hypothetical protein [bacterium]